MHEDNDPQARQELEYWFPYHYVARFDGHFTQTFSDTWGINYASTIEFVLGEIAATKFSSLVDVGCGDGRLTREIALAHPATTIVGVDFSARAIALAKAMNQGLGNADFHACDIAESGLGKSFDLATLIEVYEHLPPERCPGFLSGLRGLLRPGGELLLTVPHANKPLEYKHFRHFDVAGLCAELSPHFDIIRVLPFERIHWSRKAINALLHNNLFILNNQWFLDRIYSHYKTSLFACSTERECQRIFVRARAR